MERLNVSYENWKATNKVQRRKQTTLGQMKKGTLVCINTNLWVISQPRTTADDNADYSNVTFPERAAWLPYLKLQPSSSLQHFDTLFFSLALITI